MGVTLQKKLTEICRNLKYFFSERENLFDADGWVFKRILREKEKAMQCEKKMPNPSQKLKQAA